MSDFRSKCATVPMSYDELNVVIDCLLSEMSKLNHYDCGKVPTLDKHRRFMVLSEVVHLCISARMQILSKEVSDCAQKGAKA